MNEWMCPHCGRPFAEDRYRYVENVVILFAWHLKLWHPKRYRHVVQSRGRLLAAMTGAHVATA